MTMYVNELKPQNIHSHTTYCDGSLTPEEMVLAAIAKGCGSFGFSGHSYAPFDTIAGMSVEDTGRYVREIARLKEKYAGTIEIFTGIEQEYLAEPLQINVDYIIGSAHFVKKGSELVCIDGGEKGQEKECNAHYGGDYCAMARDYFAAVSDVARKTNCDIIGHFDLISKYNEGGRRFDETNPRYVTAAADAMREALKTCKLFEVNTGAMFRYGKSEPYPSIFWLKELRRLGGEVIISSDSHDADSICYKYADMAQLLKAIGFKYIKRLTAGGFVDVSID